MDSRILRKSLPKVNSFCVTFDIGRLYFVNSVHVRNTSAIVVANSHTPKFPYFRIMCSFFLMNIPF